MQSIRVASLHINGERGAQKTAVIVETISLDLGLQSDLVVDLFPEALPILLSAGANRKQDVFPVLVFHSLKKC